MNPTAIYSKSGKGVQEASGKTSLLKRPDRAVLSAIDGRATLAEVAQKVGRPCDAAFQAVIQQLDRDGFVREVSAGAASGASLGQASRPAAPKPPPKPAASLDPASDLDFSSLGAGKSPTPPPQRMAMPSTPSRPAAPPPPPPKPSAQQVQQAKAQQSALDKAREEAEAKAAAERERVKREAEEKAKAEIEAKMRVEAEKRMKQEAEARAKADAEAQVKAAREAAVRAAAEAKAKAEAEAKAKAEAERKAEEERRARQEMERRLEEERKARLEEEAKRQEAERKAKEEAERARREAEEKARREAEELRQRLEAERKAREEAERKAKEEEERAKQQAERLRREAEEHARKVREELEAERKRLEEERRKEEQERAARRKQREEEERREDEERAARRKQREEEEAREREEAAARAAAAQVAAAAQAAKPEAPKAEAPRPAAKAGSFADSLMADLDSFTDKDEEEQKAREESERKAKAAERERREQAEHQAAEARRREEEEARHREEEEARRREEENRRAREEEERLAREEERRKREAEEIRRKAEAATAAAMAKQASDAGDDIPISDDDLDMDEVKQERKALGIDEKKEREKAKEAEREAKRKKRAEEKRRREAEKQAARAPVPGAMRSRRSSSWGRPAALLLAVVLVAAIGAAHVVPLDVAPYEQTASEALGQPVRIGSARLWLFTGVQVRLEGVRVGDVRVKSVVTHPALGSLFGERKHFNLIELEGVSLAQGAFGEALFSRLKPGRFSVERLVVRKLELKGPLALPPLDAEAALAPEGTLRSATLYGPDGLNARITPHRGAGGEALDFEATAAGFPLPIGPELTLSQFAMKGTATRQGMDIAEWGGAIFNGGISGNAKLRWGNAWDVEGVVTVRSINAAVFAPALLSQGNADGTGRFSMSAADPAKLLASSRVDGRFTINKGTLGSFDLSRAIQSRGKQATGTTQFSELTGQASYDRGTVALRNVTIGAGALNAGASAEISKSGALSGRIVADVKTAAQTLSATLNLGGTVKEPQVRD